MKSKIKSTLLMFALLFGVAVTASAQSRSGTRYGRATVYQNDGRGYRRDDNWNYRRNDRRDNDWRRDNHWRRDNDWRSDRRWRIQKQRQVFRGQTYRLPNRRIVTILPNGRRIYR